MKSCLLCPKGKRCRGYVLHELLLRLYDAMAAGGGDPEAIARRISHEDALLLARHGPAGRETCWSKALALAMAEKLAAIARRKLDEPALQREVKNLVDQTHALAGRLPNGVRVQLQDLALEVYNAAQATIARDGAYDFHAASVLSWLYRGMTHCRRAV